MFELQRIVNETWVHEVDYRETVGSTNTTALELCRRSNSLDGPLLVLAARQTLGRGRGANQWWSVQGALTFSLVINPRKLQLPEDRWPRASLTTGLAVRMALSELLPHEVLSLKWPNDVHLNRRKVCGVLVEVGPRTSSTLVLGIGVNVNNSFEHAPPELSSSGISMADATDRAFDLTDVLIRVLKQLELQLGRLVADDPELAADWESCCALRGLTVQVDNAAVSTIGVCQGIDSGGALVLLTDGGIVRLFGGVVARIW